MTIEKCKDFEKDGYGTWDDSSKPTTYANMYDFMKNQNNVTLALANGLWQPSTAYSVGAVIHSPSLPAGCKATCTTEGTSGSTEPKWTAYGTTVTDGTVKWKVETDVQGTMDGEREKAVDDMHTTITGEMQTAINNAINSMHDTIKTEMQTEMKTAMHAQYPVGSYIYSDKADNPATYLPYMSDTTWVQTAAGRVLIGAGTADSGTVYTAGQTGGEEKHQLTVEELASHSHTLNRNSASGTGSWCLIDHEGVIKWQDGDVGSAGGDQPHNNMEPYKVVYIFMRSA